MSISLRQKWDPIFWAKENGRHEFIESLAYKLSHSVSVKANGSGKYWNKFWYAKGGQGRPAGIQFPLLAHGLWVLWEADFGRGLRFKGFIGDKHVWGEERRCRHIKGSSTPQTPELEGPIDVSWVSAGDPTVCPHIDQSLGTGCPRGDWPRARWPSLPE